MSSKLTQSNKIQIAIDGEEYTAKKLTLGDFSELEKYLADKEQKRAIKVAKELYGDNMPDDIYDRIIKATRFDLEEVIETTDGLTFLLYRALSGYNEELTFEEAAELLSLSNAKDIIEQLMPELLKKKQ